MDLCVIPRKGACPAGGIKLWEGLSSLCGGGDRSHREKRSSRFGWHNLRQFGDVFWNEIPLSTIQSMLRHTKPATTARYIHAVNNKEIEA